jgi:hypothetical protein
MGDKYQDEMSTSLHHDYIQQMEQEMMLHLDDDMHGTL